MISDFDAPSNFNSETFWIYNKIKNYNNNWQNCFILILNIFLETGMNLANTIV